MPQLVTVKVLGERRRLRIWVPVIPVLIVLSPLLVLAALVLAVACLARRINPFAALSRAWRVFAALRGLRVEVHEGPSTVLVSIV
jgi:hypothetical protein